MSHAHAMPMVHAHGHGPHIIGQCFLRFVSHAMTLALWNVIRANLILSKIFL